MLDALVPRFQAFRNHFRKLACDYEQAYYNLIAQSKSQPLEGLIDCLQYEAKERQKLSKMLADCLANSIKLPIIGALPAPIPTPKPPLETLAMLLAAEAATLPMIEAAMNEARAAKDWYSYKKMQKLWNRCMDEYLEMQGIHNMLEKANGNEVKMLEMNNYLVSKYGHNPKSKYR